jgi:LmbE family N-acetylglucosaminyl deacetylase/glycosyltransferase involved in cell wall biosynthesis
MQEHDLVPYSASPLPAGRLLVFAPHADDEVIGCGGAIVQNALRGHAVGVVIVTAGPELREEECRAATAIVGAEPPRFLRFPERRTDAEQLRAAMEEEIAAFQPALIAVPSPLEIHPDHIAVSRALFDIVHADRGRFHGLRQVAFYEVTQPMRPNRLADITAEAETKFLALSQYRSQLREREYVTLTRALNRYRAFTLAAECQYAEAFWLVDVAVLRRTSWNDLMGRVSGSASPEVIRSEVPVTVLIRTRERQPWLKEAVGSVLANTHAARVLVVNDGGASPAELLPRRDDISVINLPRVGRSEALNVAVRAAETHFVAFLDDDDVYYADHLATLVSATQSAPGSGYYTDAFYASLRMRDDGTYERVKEGRPFSCDFDRDLLLCDNYVPLATLLVGRDDTLAAGGFDPKIEGIEDWDFLIRLTRLGPLVHIPRVTCEVRLFEPRPDDLLEEKRAVLWCKHRREVREAIGRLMERRRPTAVDGEPELAAFHLAGELIRAERARDVFAARTEALTAQCARQQETVGSYNNEVKRLGDILDQIYHSRSWKIHLFAEKLRRLGA